MGEWEALGQVIGVCGSEGIKETAKLEWEALISRGESEENLLRALDGLAEGANTLADTFLQEWLANYPNREGKFSLRERNWVTELPPGLVVKGELDLTDCVSLRGLPEALHVDGLISAKGCVSIERMGEGIRARRGVRLAGCVSLRAISAGLVCGGHLTLEGCVALESLPEELDVGSGLYMMDCVSLKVLPQRLKVRQNLFLDGCLTLRSLSAGLDVGLSMSLLGCAAWDGRIPADALIGDDIRTDLHPDWISINEWRRLHPKGERG